MSLWSVAVLLYLAGGLNQWIRTRLVAEFHAPCWVKGVLLAPLNKPLELGRTGMQVLGVFFLVIALLETALSLSPRTVFRILMGALFVTPVIGMYIAERLKRRRKR